MNWRVAAEPRCQVQHGRVNDDREQSQRQNGDGQGEDPNKRPNQRIHQAKNESYEKVGEDDAQGVSSLGDATVRYSLRGRRRRDVHAGQQPARDPQCQPINDDADDEGTHGLMLSQPGWKCRSKERVGRDVDCK